MSILKTIGNVISPGPAVQPYSQVNNQGGNSSGLGGFLGDVFGGIFGNDQGNDKPKDKKQPGEPVKTPIYQKGWFWGAASAVIGLITMLFIIISNSGGRYGTRKR